MSLSAPVARTLRHTRRIVCEGFHRDDGLWDIEAVLIDTKAYRYREPERGLREVGDHVHEMHVRLTVDSTMIVRAVEIDMAFRPYGACLDAPPAFQGLVGKSIGPGWRKAIRERLGGAEGCTHMVELLIAMATPAYQTILPVLSRERRAAKDPTETWPGLINSCHAYKDDGALAKKYWPDRYRGD